MICHEWPLNGCFEDFLVNRNPQCSRTSQTPIFWTPGSCCNSCAASSVFNLAMIYDMQLGVWQGPIKCYKDWLLRQERQRGNPIRGCSVLLLYIYYIYICAFNITYICLIHVRVSVFLGMKESTHTSTSMHLYAKCRKECEVWWKQFYEALKTHDMSRTCWQTRTFVS